MAKDHDKRAQRYLQHMERNRKLSTPNTRMTTMARAVRSLFLHGLPYGWGK